MFTTSKDKTSTVAQRAVANQSNISGVSFPAVVQRKGRIDLSKIKGPEKKAEGEEGVKAEGEGVVKAEGAAVEGAEGEKEVKPEIDYAALRKEVEDRITAAREVRKQAKMAATQVWAARRTKDPAADEVYNTAIEAARRAYELVVTAIGDELKEQGIEGAFKGGDDYYGAETGEGTNIFRREDNGKQYVKDMRGTFIPRFVRRELNLKDIAKVTAGSILDPRGIKKYNALSHAGKINVPTKKKGEITWADREFLQQSGGGGENQFAFSHTSTKRPILSNDHKSFGTHPNGAILTDLSKVPQADIAAQWALHPEGHKVQLPPRAYGKLGTKGWFQDRDQTVRRSGYRNMEVVTRNIPADAIIKNPSHAGWGGSDHAGAYTPGLDDVKDGYNANDEIGIAAYAGGESARGNKMMEDRHALENPPVPVPEPASEEVPGDEVS